MGNGERKLLIWDGALSRGWGRLEASFDLEIDVSSLILKEKPHALFLDIRKMTLFSKWELSSNPQVFV